eukprot:1154237-Pelagomonas_calceolata.AAC.8
MLSLGCIDGCMPNGSLLISISSMLVHVKITEVPPFSAEANALLDKLATSLTPEQGTRTFIFKRAKHGIEMLYTVFMPKFNSLAKCSRCPGKPQENKEKVHSSSCDSTSCVKSISNCPPTSCLHRGCAHPGGRLALSRSPCLKSMVIGIHDVQAQRVKDIEKTTNHDVKAIEYMLKEHFATNAEVHKVRVESINASRTGSSSDSWKSSCTRKRRHQQLEPRPHAKRGHARADMPGTTLQFLKKACLSCRLPCILSTPYVTIPCLIRTFSPARMPSSSARWVPGCMQVLPTMDKLIAGLGQMSVEFAEVPMLARTHGQTASPTTLGKEMAVFATRLKRQRDLVCARNNCIVENIVYALWKVGVCKKTIGGRLQCATEAIQLGSMIPC